MEGLFETFDFSKVYFDELFFSTSEIMERDIVLLFALNYKISALTNEHVLPLTAEILNSRDFMVSEDSMAEIFKEVMHALSLKQPSTFAEFLDIMFVSPALTCFNKKNTLSIISHVVKQIRSPEVIKSFRRIYFEIKDKKEEKNVINFFTAVSELELGHYLVEFHSFFLKYLDKYDIMVQYAGFIANNRVSLPMQVFLNNCSSEKIFVFYRAFFKKVRKDTDMGSKEDPINRVILELFRFIVESKNKSLVQLLPLVPFVPTNLDTLYAVFELYLFLFSHNLHSKMYLFYLKTPALINISFHLFTLEDFSPEIVNFLRKMGIKETKFQNLAFLAIIYNSEYRKLRNFDFSGILEYVQDEKTLQCFDEDLRVLMRHIHLNSEFPSEDFVNAYIAKILRLTKQGTFKTTTLIFIDILSILFGKSRFSKFNLEFHRELSSILRLLENAEDKELFSSLLGLYIATLDSLKITPYILNYIVCFIADFKHANKHISSISTENITHFVSSTSFFMKRMLGFPYLNKNVFMCKCELCISTEDAQNGPCSKATEGRGNTFHISDKVLRDLYHNCSLDDLNWMIDMLYMKKNSVDVVKRSLELLKIRIYLSPNLSDLYILYKICNILNIEKNQNFYAFLVIKNTPEIIHELRTIQALMEEARGLYKYHFRSLFSVTKNTIAKTPLDEKLGSYSLEELVYFNNMYKKKEIYDVVLDKVVEKRKELVTSSRYGVLINIDNKCLDIVPKAAEVKSPPSSNTMDREDTTDIQVEDCFFSEKKWVDEKEYLYSLMEECSLEHSKYSSPVSIVSTFKAQTSFFCSVSGYFICSSSATILDLISVLQHTSAESMVDVAISTLKGLERSRIVFFIPQLVQCFFKDGFPKEFSFLLSDEVMAHQLIWCLRANKISADNILNLMDPEKKKIFLRQDKVFRFLTEISRSLKMFVRETKRFKTVQINKEIEGANQLISDIREEAEKQAIPEDLDGLTNTKDEPVSEKGGGEAGIYMPTNPNFVISNIILGSGRALQSAAKMPFMAGFRLVDGAEKKLIFKNGDDCRQDMLALQVIEIFRAIFHESKLDISLFPYKVVPTDFECGVIEVIEDAVTRDQMGKESINNLKEFFQYKFGFEESKEYIQALNNFVSSYTGYSLITYFLNIKDRHNGNIMINEHGHIIHIDFGFMLEISPGNINFEIPLKLTSEIHDLMKGSYFEKYKEMMVKGFMIIRKRGKEILWLIESFRDSNLPCFRRNAIRNFERRFMHQLSDDEAKKFILDLIEWSVLSSRTWIYDKYQALANDIRF